MFLFFPLFDLVLLVDDVAGEERRSKCTVLAGDLEGERCRMLFKAGGAEGVPSRYVMAIVSDVAAFFAGGLRLALSGDLLRLRAAPSLSSWAAFLLGLLDRLLDLGVTTFARRGLG